VSRSDRARIYEFAMDMVTPIRVRGRQGVGEAPRHEIAGDWAPGGVAGSMVI
jgi:hypothetical protein